MTPPIRLVSLAASFVLVGMMIGCGATETAQPGKEKSDPAASTTADTKSQADVDRIRAELKKVKKGGCGSDGNCCCAPSGKACACNGDTPSPMQRATIFWSANAVSLCAGPHGHGPWLAASTYAFGSPPSAK